MSGNNGESKRIDDWLTGGKPRTIRTRGAVRTRSAAPASGIAIRRIEQASELLEQLKEEVPEVPWVIVVEGSLNDFAESVCKQAKQLRASSKFWLVGSEEDDTSRESIATLAPLRLNPQDADDLRFLNNLIADLVIVSAEPKASQGERVRRWLSRARYILAEKLDVLVIEELQRSESGSGSKAEICVISSRQ